MEKRKIYIIISILIIILIGTLIVWALFIGRAQQELETPTQELGYLNSSGGGTFGNIFGSENFGRSREEPVEATPQAQLQQLYNLPSAGVVVISDDETNRIRFVDRATGHVFEKEVTGDNSRRILQTTVPRVYEALFPENGTAVIRRYLGDNESINTIYDSLREGSNPKSIALEHDIHHVRVSPKGDALVYIVETATGSTGVTSNTQGEEKETIWESGLRGWLPLWHNEDVIFLQKPAANTAGSAYGINLDTKEESTIFHQVKGLSIVPSDRFILYSRVAQNNPALWVYDRQNRESKDLGIATFAEKCVWSALQDQFVFCALPDTFPGGEYPDAWYQGRAHLADSFWRINVEDGTLAEIIAPARTHSVSLDAVNLLLDDDETHIILTNQTDQTIWGITLSPSNNENVQ